MNSTLRRGLMVLVSLALGVVFAVADDLNPPPWTRGGPRTTTQGWDFVSNTDIFGHPVGGFGNPYGVARIDGSAGVDWLNEWNSRSGVWSIAPGGFMGFLIPNDEVPQYRKEIWVQLTWWGDGGTNYVVSPRNQTQHVFGNPELVIPLTNDWFHTTTSYQLDHQPPFEWFFIDNQSSSNMYIDQLVIDTRCVPVPEPSVIALALGGLGLAAKRRRSRL